MKQIVQVVAGITFVYAWVVVMMALASIGG